MYPLVQQLLSRARSLAVEFKQRKEAQDIHEAISVDREALGHCPPGHIGRSVVLNQLAVHLHDRYKQLGSMQDADEAVALSREALGLCPLGHSQRPTSLINLANRLHGRYKRLGSMEDLDEAIVLCREALSLCPPGHSQRSTSLNNLSSFLSDRCKQLWSAQDLDEAISLCRESLDLRPLGHSLRCSSLNNLANRLFDRYKQLGSVQDLEEVIVLCQEALGLCSPGHSQRPTSLNNLASFLSHRYNQLGSTQDLNDAIVLSREALGLHPPGHSQRPTSLNNLANRISSRYKQLGSMPDLDEAIVLCREALVLCPQGHSLRCTALISLANRLSDRYNRYGSMRDFDEAIVLSREALGLCPAGHSLRSASLNSLASRLSDRYDHLGSIQDLDEAISLCREAIDLSPPGHSLRSSSLNNLAGFLADRYNQLKSVRDLEEAIVLSREVLAFSPPGHSRRSTALINLASFLSDRYKQLGSTQDVDEAIVLCRESLDLRPPGHSQRSASLNGLANHLFDRYNRLGSMEDFDEAILLSREALRLRPQGHPDRPRSLASIASYLHQRFTRLKQLVDKEELFSLYSQLVHIDQSVSPAHLSAARQWIRMAEHFQHPTLLLAYETSLRLLTHHLATLPSLPQHLSILKKHSSSLAVDAFSACLRNRAPAHAVELLEQGRSVFWSQLIRLHSPLQDVRASGLEGEKLADEFSHLSFLIRNALNSPDMDQHEQLCRLNLEMQTVVANIRELPGLSRFLLPSLFLDLQRAANAGPVIVVNSSKYGCDALVVLHDRDPVHIPLRITREDVRYLSADLHKVVKRAKIEDDVMREFVIFLRQLWDQIVSPIVDVLQKTIPNHSRIWWCPTGEFSGLPLHSAGSFRKGQHNLPALYVSSYTPTLTALIRARRSNPSDHGAEPKRFIAIGQGNAAGESELPSVAEELDMVSQAVDGLVAFTRIDGHTACIPRVVEELGTSEWVHVACHGLPNPERPFESAFALSDDHFTIQRIIGCALRNPEFAYLSACHTTVGDRESPDEVIHLASAMQFIGFRSVIGTMWAVADAETKKIAPVFYKHMVDECGRLDYTRAAYALNKTMRSVNIPFDQRILYIHLGA